MRTRRLLAVISCLPATLAFAGPVQAAPSPDVVVSGVYGGGGNTGAPLSHDYVELFNRGTAPVSLNGLSVQYASATGTGNLGNGASQLTELPNATLQPGQAFLVQQAGTGTSTLPAPDFVDPTPINLSATGGKVALAQDTTSLGCNGGSTPCDSAALARIRDLVGYGSANFSEGAAAPAASNTTALARDDDGCVDTDSNADDFAAVTPAPRNSSTAREACGGGDTDTAPDVTAFSPADGAAGVSPDVSPTVTFSEPVAAGTGAFSLACGPDTVAITVSGGPTTFTLDPGAALPAGASCTVSVEADTITDVDGDDPPDNPAADRSATFTVAEGCGGAFTTIPEIQGSGATSPLTGDNVSTEGVVTAAFQGTGAISGFFMQDTAGDLDPNTSDGLFVFSSTPVETGRSVRVSGRVAEFRRSSAASPETLTQLTSATVVTCALEPVALPPAATIDLPTPRADLERFEGMRITTVDELSVTELFSLRFGEVLLSTGGPLVQPTEVMAPGAAAQAQFAADTDRTLLLDDGRSVSDPFPNPYTTPADALRRGDVIDGSLEGVLHFDFDTFRVQPTTAPAFTERNPRPLTPPDVGGDLQVASFNVLNYFLTFGRSEDRGAPNAAEFAEQEAKIVEAINGLEAEVVTLQEVQDTSDEPSFGNDPDAALSALVDALNEDAGSERWAFVPAPTEPWANTDEIRLGIIYQPAAVGLDGEQEQFADARFTGIARVPLAQTFTADAERFTVVANHFKSKGCDGASGADADQADGQSCFNATRVEQAEAELEFVAELRASSGDDDVLVLGDLNSYTREDPIRTLTTGGLIDLGAREIDADDRYSFVFFGRQGALDHALATASLAAKVSGSGIWHINADESRVYEYGGTPGLYAPDPYRSSDHDADLIGIETDLVERGVGLTRAGSSTNVQRLRFFDLDAPNVITSQVAISGLLNGEQLQGIDYRPATGELIGLGRKIRPSTAPQSQRAYVIDPATGVATPEPVLNQPLGEGKFGVDFNPVVDRLRTTSSNQRNLRTNVDDGITTVDGNLAYAAGDPKAGKDPDIVASAYTNNVDGATTTTLYNIDVKNRVLAIQAPPNAGTLTTVGALPSQYTPDVGFDISGVSGIGYASLVRSGDRPRLSQLYRVNLGTGRVTIVGTIGNGANLEGITTLPSATETTPAAR